MVKNAIPCVIKKSGGVLKGIGKEYPALIPAHKIVKQATREFMLKNEQVGAFSYAGTMAALPYVLTSFLSVGHPVEVEGLGTFFITMKGDIETDANGKKSLKDACVDKITFHPDVDFLRMVRSNTKFALIRSNGGTENDAD